MGRKNTSSIYLDTHIVVWLYAGLLDKFSDQAIELLDTHDILISPLVQLELEYLYEIKRIKVKVADIIDYLQSKIGLKVSEESFNSTIQTSMKCKWTRDPFDRIISATAIQNSSYLLTADKNIIKNYDKAII